MDLKTPERRIEEDAQWDILEIIRQARKTYLRETTCGECDTHEDDAALYPVNDGTMICEFCMPVDESASPSGFNHDAKYGEQEDQ